MYRIENGRLAGRERQWLTDAQLAEVRRLLAEGATQPEAAAAIGVSYRRLRSRLDDQLADVRVGRGRTRRGHKKTNLDIPADLIWLRAAEVRRGWSVDRWAEAASHHRRLPEEPRSRRQPGRPD